MSISTFAAFALAATKVSRCSSYAVHGAEQKVRELSRVDLSSPGPRGTRNTSSVKRSWPESRHPILETLHNESKYIRFVNAVRSCHATGWSARPFRSCAVGLLTQYVVDLRIVRSSTHSGRASRLMHRWPQIGIPSLSKSIIDVLCRTPRKVGSALRTTQAPRRSEAEAPHEFSAQTRRGSFP